MPVALPNPQLKHHGPARSHMIFRVLAAALLIGCPMAAQSPGTQGPPPTPHLQVTDPSSGFGNITMDARQVKLLNIQRQKAIVDDAGKILLLARELNADASSDTPVMSDAQRLHKAEEIEKLAKSIREKMTNGVGLPQPPTPTPPGIRPAEGVSPFEGMPGILGDWYNLS